MEIGAAGRRLDARSRIPHPKGNDGQGHPRPPRRFAGRARAATARAGALLHRGGRRRREHDRAVRRRSGFRDRARPRPRRAARALRQAAPDVDRAGQPPHRHSARRRATEPAHAREARFRCGRRRAPVLPSAPRAVVLARLSVGVADRGARAADPRPPGRVAARSVLARDARRRRDRLHRPLDVVADHVAVAQRRAAPSRVLHVDRPRDARPSAAARARRLSRARPLPSVHRLHAEFDREAAGAAQGRPRIGLRFREPDDGAAPVHARGAGARRGWPLRRRHQRHPAGRLVSRDEMAERYYQPLQEAALELGSLLLP